MNTASSTVIKHEGPLVMFFLLPRKALASNGTLTVNEILCHRKLNTDIPLVERSRKEEKKKKKNHSNRC